MTSLPNFVRPEAQAVAPDLTLLSDLLGGTRTMQGKFSAYVKKWPDETDAVFDFRKQYCDTVFEGYGRTLSAATGMLFAKPPAMLWNASEERISPQWDNVDAAGTKGTVLLKRFSEAALRDGVGAILVDHPPVPEGGATSKLEETERGYRPTWALYGRAQIINWRTAVIENRRTLQMAVLHEQAELPDGDFGIKLVHRWRVLRLILTPTGLQATWKLWESDKVDASKVEEFRDVGGGVFQNNTGQAASFLPLSIAYTGRTDTPMTASIPLLGVAWANLAHWQQSSDLRFYRGIAAFPQPVVIGEIPNDPITNMPGKFKMGPLVVINLKGEGASFTWAELEGSSMTQLENGIREKLSQMSMLGVSFLAGDKRAAETAEAKRLDATAENSTLATAAQGIEDAVNSALEFHAWYLGIEKKDAPVLTINRDFEANVMDSQVMTAWAEVCQKTGMPFRQLLEAFKAGGRLAADADLDEIEGEAATNLEAARREKEQARKDALALQEDPALAA
jgi:hypothetical protein